MSVTFTCHAVGAWRDVPCTSPELGLTCLAGARCGYCEDGVSREWVTQAPEVNLSNNNAMLMLSMLNLPQEYDGAIALEDAHKVLQRILYVLNVDHARHVAIREPSIDLGAARCRLVDFGNTDEQTMDRLERLRDLLVFAIQHQVDVSWE